MNKPICLVTGANSGIGKEITLGLARSGAKVIMVCRNPEKGRIALEEIKAKSGSASVDLLIADLSSQTDIRMLSATIHERYPDLNILINNAGIVEYSREKSNDGIEMTLATNHLGPFLLTSLLLDLLKKNSTARIINISSAIHKWGKIDLNDLQFERRRYQFMKAYAQSKLLMNIASFELARKLAGSGVTVNCVHPGAVRTHLGSDSARNIFLKSLDWMIKFFFISPEDAARFPCQLALSPDMEKVTGRYFVKGKDVPASASCYDPDLAKKVWIASERLTGG